MEKMTLSGLVKNYRKKVPDAEVYEVKGGGHHPHFVGDQIEEINARMLEFLAAIHKKIDYSRYFRE